MGKEMKIFNRMPSDGKDDEAKQYAVIISVKFRSGKPGLWMLNPEVNLFEKNLFFN